MVSTERIANAIVVVRGMRVLLDADLAALYGVKTKALNQAVRRNQERFPLDFVIQLTQGEQGLLRSQSVTSSSHGGRRWHPYAFTEQGVAMLSSILKSPRAIAVNIEIVRAFVHLRRMLRSHADLAEKFDALELKYDGQFREVFQAIRELMTPTRGHGRSIGFRRPG